METENYSKAFVEVYVVIENLTDELKSLIPSGFIKIVCDNKDENYIVTEELLKEKGMMKETKAILSLIYRDFFCNDETRDMLLKEDEQEIKEKNQMKFDQKVKVEKTKNELIVIEKKKWYQKIFDVIAKLILH